MKDAIRGWMQAASLPSRFVAGRLLSGYGRWMPRLQPRAG